MEQPRDTRRRRALTRTEVGAIMVGVVLAIALVVFFSSGRDPDRNRPATACTPPRPRALQLSRTVEVQAQVAKLIEVARGAIRDSSSLLQVVHEAPGTDEFEARAYALCEARRNGDLTQQQYAMIFSGIFGHPTDTAKGRTEAPSRPALTIRGFAPIEQTTIARALARPAQVKALTVEATSSGTIDPLPGGRGLYLYSGGSLQLKVNESDCGGLDARIPPTSQYGNQLSEVEAERRRMLESVIRANISAIVEALLKCAG